MRSATERAVCWPSGAPGRLWRWPLLWPIGGQCSSALYTGFHWWFITMSTLYHAFPFEGVKRLFRVFDHSSIYLLIAGSYTPFTLILLDGTWKRPVICGVVWAAALLGVTLNAVSVERFEKFSMLLYIAMGWAVGSGQWAHRTNPAWAYGFPELSKAHREKIQKAQFVANPGCHATGFISLVLPWCSWAFSLRTIPWPPTV